MAQLDERTRRDLARLRDRVAPSEAAKRRMYASLEAQLGGDGGGDDDPGGELSGDGGAGHGVWVAKVVGATAGLTAGGLVALRLGVELVRALSGAPQSDARQEHAPEQQVELTSAPERDEEPELATFEAAPPEPAPPGEATEPSRPTKRQSDAVPHQRPAADGSTLAAEIAMLEAAHGAQDPAAALIVLERHLAQFPSGELADERELLRVETLCRLDRLTEARALAERFSSERPGSALRQRIASACPASAEPQEN
jgi:hypothetical protein